FRDQLLAVQVEHEGYFLEKLSVVKHISCQPVYGREKWMIVNAVFGSQVSAAIVKPGLDTDGLAVQCNGVANGSIQESGVSSRLRKGVRRGDQDRQPQEEVSFHG